MVYKRATMLAQFFISYHIMAALKFVPGPKRPVQRSKSLLYGKTQMAKIALYRWPTMHNAKSLVHVEKWQTLPNLGGRLCTTQNLLHMQRNPKW